MNEFESKVYENIETLASLEFQKAKTNKEKVKTGIANIKGTQYKTYTITTNLKELLTHTGSKIKSKDEFTKLKKLLLEDGALRSPCCIAIRGESNENITIIDRPLIVNITTTHKKIDLTQAIDDEIKQHQKANLKNIRAEDIKINSSIEIELNPIFTYKLNNDFALDFHNIGERKEKYKQIRKCSKMPKFYDTFKSLCLTFRGNNIHNVTLDLKTIVEDYDLIPKEIYSITKEEVEEVKKRV